jgi:hypothetical protein
MEVNQLRGAEMKNVYKISVGKPDNLRVLNIGGRILEKELGMNMEKSSRLPCEKGISMSAGQTSASQDGSARWSWHLG